MSTVFTKKCGKRGEGFYTRSELDSIARENGIAPNGKNMEEICKLLKIEFVTNKLDVNKPSTKSFSKLFLYVLHELSTRKRGGAVAYQSILSKLMKEFVIEAKEKKHFSTRVRNALQKAIENGFVKKATHKVGESIVQKPNFYKLAKKGLTELKGKRSTRTKTRSVSSKRKTSKSPASKTRSKSVPAKRNTKSKSPATKKKTTKSAKVTRKTTKASPKKTTRKTTKASPKKTTRKTTKASPSKKSIRSKTPSKRVVVSKTTVRVSTKSAPKKKRSTKA